MKSLFTFFLVAWVAVAGWADPSSFKVVQWSDIHNGGKAYSETAFNQAIQKGLSLEPQGIVLTGDFCDNSHDPEDYYTRLREGLHLVVNRIRKEKVPVFMALGNDDLPHNYQTPPAEVQESVNCFREAFGDGCYLDDLGNGVSPNHLGGLTWISVNSLFFSFKNSTPQADPQALRTLTWLTQQLPPAPSEGPGSKRKAPPVVIVTHIPPAWDLVLNQPGWKVKYLSQFQQIVAHYPGQVFMLCGHYHRNHIQAIEREEREPVVILSCGALATKYGYHSNWRELTFHENDEGQVSSLSYTIHYPEKSSWDDTYLIVPRKLEDFFNNLMSSEALYRRYIADIFGHSSDFMDQAADGKVKDQLRDQFWVRADMPEPEPKPSPTP